MQQLETRERLEEAMQKKDSAFLDSLRSTLTGKRKLIENQIGESIDARKDYAGAAELVRKLMFLEKLDAEIDAAYEAIERLEPQSPG
jgi:molecular chaperone HscB